MFMNIVKWLIYYVYKHSKIYVTDLSLCSLSSFVFSEDTDRLAENVVAIELFRRGYEVWYWKKAHEIDFVAKRQNIAELLLINVCFTSEIPDRETKGFAEFREEFPDIPVHQLILTEDFAGFLRGFPVSRFGNG